MAGAWELRNANLVTVGILHTELVSSYWAQGFRRLVIPGPEPLWVAGMPFDHARNFICERALANGSQYCLHLDSDVVPPADAILRLIRHNLPVVSGVYCRRSPPHGIPVMQRNFQWVTDLPKPGQNPLIEVDVVGAGFLLIRRDVLENFPHHAPGKQWFHWRVDQQGHRPVTDCLSEDFCFCKAFREKMGGKVMVDTSVRCLHGGQAEADFGQFAPAGALPRPA